MKLLGTCCQVAATLGLLVAICFCWDLATHQPPYTPTEQRKRCISNLQHQIGIGLRLWASNHRDQFPFGLSTNAGGTLEYCAAGVDGFDSNAYLHFQVASNELGDPACLLCPEDHCKKAATNFQTLEPTNITYRLRSAPETNSTREVLATCPIHGYLLHQDGDVTVLETAKDKGTSAEIVKFWRHDPSFRIAAKQVLASAAAALLLFLIGTWLKHMRQTGTTRPARPH